METRRHKQISLAQNFLKSPKLVRRLVAKSTINSTDIVYDIGAGRGIITAELARRANRVIAIEKDPRLIRALRERFRTYENVEVVEADFLAYRLGRMTAEYKIFASIPYNQTARIMRKILHERPAPSEAYLVLQKEAARKFSGHPRETMFSVFAKPFFESQVVYKLQRTDFDPVPDVDSVLLRITRRKMPLIVRQDVPLYHEFVHYGFCRWKQNLRLAYKNIFTYKQWKRLAREWNLSLNATPSELNFEQWLGLFQYFKLKQHWSHATIKKIR